MRLTRAGEYAIRCVYYLSLYQGDEVISQKEIALQMDIPVKFLTKVSQQLARAGIVEIIRGPKGGLKLSAPPHAISLLDVIEAMTGEIFLNDCVLRPDSCKRSPTCSIHRVWIKARDQLRETLLNATFARLVEDGACPPLENSE